MKKKRIVFKATISDLVKAHQDYHAPGTTLVDKVFTAAENELVANFDHDITYPKKKKKA